MWRKIRIAADNIDCPKTGSVIKHPVSPGGFPPEGASVWIRSGMNRLAALVEAQTGNSPYVPDTLYLFCGRRADRIKGLVWEGDGWLLLYKRLSESRFQWPRSQEEVLSLTPQRFRWLMEGLTITPKKSVKSVEPPEFMG